MQQSKATSLYSPRAAKIIRCLCIGNAAASGSHAYRGLDHAIGGNFGEMTTMADLFEDVGEGRRLTNQRMGDAELSSFPRVLRGKNNKGK